MRKGRLVADLSYQPVVTSYAVACQVSPHLIHQDYDYSRQNNFQFPGPSHHINFPPVDIIGNDNCNPKDVHKSPSNIPVSLFYKHFTVITSIEKV